MSMEGRILAIMCQRVSISADGFYGGMSETANLYTAPNESVLNLHNLANAEGGALPNDCRMDAADMLTRWHMIDVAKVSGGRSRLARRINSSPRSARFSIDEYSRYSKHCERKKLSCLLYSSMRRWICSCLSGVFSSFCFSLHIW